MKNIKNAKNKLFITLLILFTLSFSALGIFGYFSDADVIETSVTVADTVTATFDGNGGTDGGKIERFAGNKICTLPTSERTGYTFTGWNTKADESGDTITADTLLPPADVTYYAQWKANTYKVSFNANGGTVSTSSKTVTYASTYGELPTPTRTGYTFNGWYTAASGGTKVTSTSTVSITSAQTLYAQWTGPKAFAVYSDDDKSLRFYKTVTDDIPSAGDTYNNLTATAVYTGIEEESYSSYSAVPWYSYRTSITNVVVEDEISPISTAYWFYKFQNCASMDLQELNTSNVKNFRYMFYDTGYNATTFDIGDLSSWDVSSGTNFSYMFSDAGYNATTWNIGDLSGWDVSSGTNFYRMFANAGRSATTWSIGDLSGWDVSSGTDFSFMFYFAGRIATTWNIGDLSNWDVSSGTDFSYMFFYAGYNATTFELDLSNWDVSSGTNFSFMFSYAGYNATTFELDLSNWDVSSGTNFGSMFNNAGFNATTFELDLSDWDVSSGTNFSYMFSYAGFNATTFDIGDLSGWDVSSGTNFSSMFYYAGRKAIYYMDLSGWDVSNATSYSSFNAGVTSRIKSPF